MTESRELRDALDRVPSLLAKLQKGEDPSAGAAVETISILLELQGVCLARIFDAVRELGEPSAGAVLDRLAEDELVASVLLVHGIRPQSPGGSVRSPEPKGRGAIGSTMLRLVEDP